MSEWFDKNAEDIGVLLAILVVGSLLFVPAPTYPMVDTGGMICRPIQTPTTEYTHLCKLKHSEPQSGASK